MPEYTLLLVDDEPNILSALRRLLRREGYKLHLAASGEEALEILAGEHVDLILTDGKMPGMDGIELLKRVKAQHPEVMRLILSGYTSVKDVADAINEGEAYRFILKPWNDEELKLTLRHALEHRRLAQENRQLYQRVKDQNEELRQLNASLEQAVAKKADELMVRSHVLMLAQEILDQLPIAVIGVSADGTVVQANRRALAHEMVNNACVGADMAHCLPPDIQHAVNDTISTGQAQTVAWRDQHEADCVVCCPLLGQPGVRGAVVLIHSLVREPAP